ncbi:MAG: hypothetical protein KDK05_02050 [Candidatus Competibacteraceae bacterium]|nr:hypothetical protein [Candidatus Competibacteraceae bacterium]
MIDPMMNIRSGECCYNCRHYKDTGGNFKICKLSQSDTSPHHVCNHFDTEATIDKKGSVVVCITPTMIGELIKSGALMLDASVDLDSVDVRRFWIRHDISPVGAIMFHIDGYGLPIEPDGGEMRRVHCGVARVADIEQ